MNLVSRIGQLNFKVGFWRIGVVLTVLYALFAGYCAVEAGNEARAPLIPIHVHCSFIPNKDYNPRDPSPWKLLGRTGCEAKRVEQHDPGTKTIEVRTNDFVEVDDDGDYHLDMNITYNHPEAESVPNKFSNGDSISFQLRTLDIPEAKKYANQKRILEWFKQFFIVLGYATIIYLILFCIAFSVFYGIRYVILGFKKPT